MQTKIINLKTFRQKITSLWKEAKKNNIRFIVMFHSTPVLEVLPYKDDQLLFSSTEKQIKNNTPQVTPKKQQETNDTEIFA